MKKIDSFVEKKVGKALGDYSMLENNDKILVCVSGGKDSLTLLDVLVNKKRYLPVSFEIYVATINFGFNIDKNCLTKLENYFKNLGVKYYFVNKDLPSTDKQINCFWCSWNRRKEIFILAKELNCNKVALGHTLDDVVITFLMNLFYHGEISTMPALLKMFGGEITLIRPLVYLTSEETKKYVEYKDLPVLNFQCPYFEKEWKLARRKYLDRLLTELQQYWPNIKLNIFNSLRKIKREYLV
ncbi:MAG: hypothetical protein N2643_00990 [Endomicrobia bacterium]|nr:hypothetical protein [Endomicrobiia bacterium]